MKLSQSIILILLCIAFVPSLALGQSPEIDALKEKAEKWDAKSRVSNLYKDLSMVTDALNNLEIKCPFGNLTTELLKNAVDQGLSDTDFSKLYLDYYKLINE